MAEGIASSRRIVKMHNPRAIDKLVCYRVNNRRVHGKWISCGQESCQREEGEGCPDCLWLQFLYPSYHRSIVECSTDGHPFTHQLEADNQALFTWAKRELGKKKGATQWLSEHDDSMT